MYAVLSEALASIEAQPYRYWQILASDNGSNEGSVDEVPGWIPERLPGGRSMIIQCPSAISRARLMREQPIEWYQRFCAAPRGGYAGMTTMMRREGKSPPPTPSRLATKRWSVLLWTDPEWRSPWFCSNGQLCSLTKSTNRGPVNVETTTAGCSSRALKAGQFEGSGSRIIECMRGAAR